METSREIKEKPLTNQKIQQQIQENPENKQTGRRRQSDHEAAMELVVPLGLKAPAPSGRRRARKRFWAGPPDGQNSGKGGPTGTEGHILRLVTSVPGHLVAVAVCILFLFFLDLFLQPHHFLNYKTYHY